MTLDSYVNWYDYLQTAGPRMSTRQMEACARLAIVLLCGEKSAIQIFQAEVARARAPAVALNALQAIEYDEHLHERSLRSFCEFLPHVDDGHALKRRAQRFFASLGRVDDMARHFGQISHLDSAVCKIMWHIENSSINNVSPLLRLAAQIKNDEARHVAVSRRYASTLGLTSSRRYEDAAFISEGLVNMLDPLADSFEVVGVDSDKLFAQIRKAPAP